MSSITTITLGVLAATAAILSSAAAQSTTASCSPLKPTYAAPSVASGYAAAPVATGLFKPRGIIFDTAGKILVVQKNKGIVGLTLNDAGGTCVTVKESKTVVENTNLNHGIALSPDGKTLYASTVEEVFAWVYDPATGAVGANKTIIKGMNNTDHVTRTLLLSQKVPGVLIVSRGSAGNIDSGVVDIKTSRAQIKSFDLNKIGDNAYDFTNDGTIIGWGIRNAVGIAEDPTSGALYSVENSSDDLWRLGKDIHENNPGEKLNFHGYLNGTKTAEEGGNFGYPDCYAAWNVTDLPENGNLTVGKQFVVNITTTINDDFCQKERVAPRLTFQAHMAPLDIKFSADGKEAYVTFHGSWDRDTPVGYKISVVAFSNGSPTSPPNSITAATDIVSITNSTTCPDGSLAGLSDSSTCFRPVGLAWDTKGRLFMSSDATGELWVVEKSTTGSTTGGATPTKTSGAGRVRGGLSGVLTAVPVLLFILW